MRVLKNILPLVSEINVRLIDSGMPSFWSLEMEGIQLIIGLSGWTTQDWAAKARFSAMIPASDSSKEIIEKAANFLKTNLIIEDEELSRYLNNSPMEAKRILQRLCLLGAAMYDPELKKYRSRELFPNFDFEEQSNTGIEEIKGIALFKSNAFRILSDNTSNAPVVLAVIIRSAPACANFNATAKPNPLEEPVTRAILFLKYFFINYL